MQKKNTSVGHSMGLKALLLFLTFCKRCINGILKLAKLGDKKSTLLNLLFSGKHLNMTTLRTFRNDFYFQNPFSKTTSKQKPALCNFTCLSKNKMFPFSPLFYLKKKYLFLFFFNYLFSL